MNIKVLLLVILYLSLVTGIAQPGTLRKAIQNFNDSDFTEAKIHIDKASKHPKTQDLSQTWNYVFLIYEKLLDSDPAPDLSVFLTTVNAREKLSVLDKEQEFLPHIKRSFSNVEEAFYRALDDNLYQGENQIQFLKALIRLLRFQGKNVGFEAFSLAQELHGARRYDSAMVYYDMAIENGFEELECYKYKLSIYSVQNDLDNFLDVFEIASARFPDDEEISLAEVNFLITNNLLFKARTELNRYLNLHPKNGNGYLLLGRISEEMGLEDEAVQAYLNAIALNSPSFEAYFVTGNYYYKQWKLYNYEGLKVKSKEYLENAEKMAPDNPDILDVLEQYYLDTRDITNYQRIRQKKAN